MRFQIRELLDRAVILAVGALIHEAGRKELVWTVVEFGIAHDGLLGHANYVAGWDNASIGELEVFQDLALDGYYAVARGYFEMLWPGFTATYKSLTDRGGPSHAESSPSTVSACSGLSLGVST